MSRRRGFTLIEMLVAVTIAALMVAMMASITSQSASVSARSNNTLLAVNAANAALDLLVTDLDSLVLQRGGAEYLHAEVPTPVDNVVATRLFFTSLGPNDIDTADDAGQVRAILYQVTRQNPIGTRSGNDVFGLYRTVISAADTFQNVMGLPNLTTYSGWPSTPPRDDFLVGNVARFQVLFSGGNTTLSNPLPVNQSSGSFPNAPQTVRLSGNATLVNGTAPAAANLPLTTAEISLTILQETGAQRFRNGAIPLDQAMRQFGHTLTRRVVLRQSVY